MGAEERNVNRKHQCSTEDRGGVSVGTEGCSVYGHVTTCVLSRDRCVLSRDRCVPSRVVCDSVVVLCVLQSRLGASEGEEL